MAITIEVQPEALSASGNRLYFVVKTDGTDSLNYVLTAKVVILDADGTEDELPSMQLYPNSGGEAELDVSRIIDNRLKPIFPDLSQKTPIRLIGFTLQFKIVFSGSYGGVLTTVETQVFTVVKGKFPKGQTVTAFVQEGNYLTNGGSVFETVADGIHYLTALLLTKGNYTVNVKAVTEDGNLIEKEIGSFTAEANDVYALPVGLKHLVFERAVRQYTVWVARSSGVAVLKEMTFRVRPMVKRYRPMVYLNVLGGIDSVVLMEMSETMKTERESYRADGLRQLSELIDYTDAFEATTGYITTEAAKLCRELVISDQVYLLHSNNLMAVNIEKGSYKLFTEADDLQSLTLKYSFAEQDYPVLSDDGGGIAPEPEPDPLPDPEPEPGKVVAACPDSVDDYLTIKNPSALNLMTICPLTSGMKIIYTLDMIPNLGYSFSVGRKDLFYLGFMFVGKGLIIQAYFNQKSKLVYQETVADYRDRRVTVELSVENTGTDLILGLLLNGVAESLSFFEADESYKPGADFFHLFCAGGSDPLYGKSKIVSFAIDGATGSTTSRQALWDFRENDPLLNKAGKDAFDLIAHNVTDMGEFIKEVPFKY